MNTRASILLALLFVVSACTEGAYYSPGETTPTNNVDDPSDQGGADDLASADMSTQADASMRPADMPAADMTALDMNATAFDMTADMGQRDQGQPGDMNASNDMGAEDMGAPVDMGVPDMGAVDMAPPSELCATQIPGLRRQERLGRPPGPYATTYEELYGPFGSQSGQVYINLGEDAFFSLPLRTPPASRGEVGAPLIWEIVPGHPDSVRVSISRCASAPLLANAISPDCYVQKGGSSGGLTMVSNSMSNLRGLCHLDPDTDYFFNVAFIDAAGNGACTKMPNTNRDICQWLTNTK